jgi:preprotein translocase subunit SecF
MSNLGSFANRLYRGEANLNIVGHRMRWFGVAGVVLLVAILALLFAQLTLGIEFKGGNEFKVPATVSAQMSDVESAVDKAVHDASPDATVKAGQKIGTGPDAVYSFQTSTLTTEQNQAVVQALATKYNINVDQIADSQVSGKWGQQVTNQALLSLAIFIAAVTAYLSIRFEWRMAVAAVASLVFNLIATAGVYALSGFEVTPSTVIGFLTILGFALYDVVVVFDKVQENTRGITGSSTTTYAEATNLALNQTFMRSINTSLVALLPVGGLLFIGAGLLGAGTLKDLGLVLFIGMGMAVYSSLFFASPVLVWLKEMEPGIANHTKRILARRSGLSAKAADGSAIAPALAGAGPKVGPAAPVTPKTGAKPAAKQTTAKQPAKPRSGAKPARPGSGKRR